MTVAITIQRYMIAELTVYPDTGMLPTDAQTDRPAPTHNVITVVRDEEEEFSHGSDGAVEARAASKVVKPKTDIPFELKVCTYNALTDKGFNAGGGEDEVGAAARQQEPALAVKNASFHLGEVQAGSQAAVTGYWHELYTLFEQDAALEDAAGGVEHWEEGPAEGAGSEASEDEPGASSRQPAGEASRGPVVGYSVRVRVAHAGAVLALGAEGHPRPCGVPVVPGAAAGTLGDQAQLCMESWEVTVMQLAAGSGAEGGPSVTGLVRSLAVFLHRRSDGGQEQTPMQAGMARRARGQQALRRGRSFGVDCELRQQLWAPLLPCITAPRGDFSPPPSRRIPWQAVSLMSGL
ncbi:unnamed protein product [Prorocentrum cordatum]|uniref:Uncharacterized protein n=1 Tax=Prorocentrum cordatum TaxID=2364126 RepID=A0ABN9PM30_9DINO|nr:unnamed protein product [Polarella glacialis]